MGYQEIKLELPDVPKLKLKGLFLGHLLLISWATLGQWGEQANLIHNLMFLSCFIWSIALPQSEDSIFLCLATNILSIFLEIIILTVHYPSLTNSHTVEFSAVMAVFNLLLRLASSYILYQEWGDRKGVVGVSVVKASHAEGGSVRSGSVLTHYPGHYDGKVQESPSHLPPLPPSYSVNN